MTKLESKETEASNSEVKEDETAACRKCGAIFTTLVRIPVLGEALRITNAYVYSGDLDSDCHFAPISLWVKRNLGNVMIATALMEVSAFSAWPNGWMTQHLPSLAAADTRLSPGNLIIEIFPNLLGFGIGVYALIFTLSSMLIKGLHEQLTKPDEDGTQRAGSALVLSADMAYPLLAITTTLAIGVFQQAFPSSHWLTSAAWFALWYSVLMAIEILATLFNLADNELINKLNGDK